MSRNIGRRDFHKPKFLYQIHALTILSPVSEIKLANNQCHVVRLCCTNVFNIKNSIEIFSCCNDFNIKFILLTIQMKVLPCFHDTVKILKINSFIYGSFAFRPRVNHHYHLNFTVKSFQYGIGGDTWQVHLCLYLES